MQESIQQGTKAALIQSAERLIGEKGLGAVSVKEVTRAAGAKNPSAIYYHFGDMESLIREVFAQRYRDIERRSIDRLAKLDAKGGSDQLVPYLEATLTPFMEACLEEEGRLYIRFCMQLAADPNFNVSEITGDLGMESVKTVRNQFTGSLKNIPRKVLITRLRQGLTISLVQAADYARRVEDGTAPSLKQAVREAAVSLAGYLSAEI